MNTEQANNVQPVGKAIAAAFVKAQADFGPALKTNTNPHFKSNEALREAMGYILGMGFAFKAKPEAFASSSCANKIVN